MKKNKKSDFKKLDNIYGYLFISPWLIGFFLVTLIPFVYSLYLAFTDYRIIAAPEWIGLDNFKKMFTADKDFWLSFKITLKFALIQIPTKLAVSLLVAVILSRVTKVTNGYRVAFYIPSLMGGTVAVAMTWKQLWGPKGAINQMLEAIGIKGVNWLHDTDTALYILIILGLWQFGSQMLIFLAAIKNVPASLHEAAIIDGAGSARRFWSITLPMITSSLFFNLINGIIGALQVFNSAFLVTEGGPLKSTLFYALYQYRQAFEYMNMGYASAMAWFLMMVIVVFTALIFKSQSAWVYYEDDNGK